MLTFKCQCGTISRFHVGEVLKCQGCGAVLIFSWDGERLIHKFDGTSFEIEYCCPSCRKKEVYFEVLPQERYCPRCNLKMSKRRVVYEKRTI